MKSSRIKHQSLIILTLTLISIIYTLIFLYNFDKLTGASDLIFHLARIKSLPTIFKSPINMNVFNYTGQAINLFYPYLTLLPAAFFYFVTNNLIISYIAYIFLITLITLLVSYYCGLSFFNSSRSGFIFAIFYSFAAYRATDLFFRAALPEGVALTFMPLVFLGTYKVLERNKNGYWILALGISLITYTHVLSVIMCLVFILLALIIKFYIRFQDVIATLVDFFKSAILTLLLTMAFWLPMLEQMSIQKIHLPFTRDLQTTLQLGKLIIESLNNNLTYYGFGLLGLISLFTPIFFKKGKFQKKYLYIWYLDLIATFLTTNLFPWRLLQNTPVNIIQFPWRFMGVQSLFASILVTYILTTISTKNSKQLISFFICLNVLIMSASSINLHRTLASLRTVNLDSTSTFIAYDYVPQKSMKWQNKIQKKYILYNSSWQKHHYTIENNKFNIKIVGKNKQVVLPVYYYKGATVFLNKKNVPIIPNKYGLIKIKTNKQNNFIQIGYQYTKLAKISLIVSLSTIITLIIYVIFRKIYKYLYI